MKTHDVLKMIAMVQAAGGVAALVDETKTVTVEDMRAAGVRVHEILVSQPDTREQATEIAETLRRSNAVDLIVSATFTHTTRVVGHEARLFRVVGSFDIAAGD
jgi:RecA/RadA recombinase